MAFAVLITTVLILLSFIFLNSDFLVIKIKDMRVKHCRSFCGNITIVPPLSLKGSTTNCIYPGQRKYELTCNSNNRAILNLFSSDYYVISIFYYTYNVEMKVVDVGMANHSCRIPIHSLPASKVMSPDFPYYHSFQKFHSNIWVSFVNCSNEVKNNTKYKPVTCLGNNTDSKSFIYFIVSEAAYRVGNLASSCSFLAITAMSYPAAPIHSGTDIFKLLAAKGFTVGADGYYYNLLLDTVLWMLPQITSLVIAHNLFGRLVVAPLIIYGFLYYKFRKTITSVDNVERLLRMQKSLVLTRYAYTDIIALTSHVKEKLGHGGFGSVFKGQLLGNRLIAIKMLGHSKANGEDFINEISTIGRIHHVNVVRLIGFYLDGSQRALVYEYMANGSLDKFIFSSNNGSGCRFSSKKLIEIALGIARGIDYCWR